MPRDSRTSAGAPDNSEPVSTSTEPSWRDSPGRAGFSISTSARNVPMSSDTLPPWCAEYYHSTAGGVNPSRQRRSRVPQQLARLLESVTCDVHRLGRERNLDRRAHRQSPVPFSRLGRAERPAAGGGGGAGGGAGPGPGGFLSGGARARSGGAARADGTRADRSSQSRRAQA